jgi:TRAP-type C4-dicarboxylate transport system substrate-binding protein
MNGLLIGKRALDKLSAEQRQAVVAAGKAATATQRKTAAADVEQLVKKLEKEGMKINVVSNVGAFRESVKPVYDKFRKSPSAPLLDAVLAEAK